MDEIVLKYTEDTQCKIYKKRLSYKCSVHYHNYYLIVKNNEIINVICEKEDESISEEKISKDNAELIVYKVVENIGEKYYSYRSRSIEYILNEEMVCETDFGFFFCKTIEEARENNFENQPGNIGLKVKVNIDDITGGSERNLMFSKCTPLEII